MSWEWPPTPSDTDCITLQDTEGSQTINLGIVCYDGSPNLYNASDWRTGIASFVSYTGDPAAIPPSPYSVITYAPKV